jgi:hypothetical protein
MSCRAGPGGVRRLDPDQQVAEGLGAPLDVVEVVNGRRAWWKKV